ncbi:hypothetical protein [Thalassomonas haliotis]|uniref:Lantibiotic n=1 Tax=Thalassomonas haliotis TaxID=485448 RepID=A0ABY7VKD9_9GAMM|nr:hypothetical protein [Thalassomonas haliotis]WDE13965.1 hypothetical protein H3N35_11260 [Thalassomonas haliotis]
MKLKLNKKQLQNLSKDNSALPAALIPQVAGGGQGGWSDMQCLTQSDDCGLQMTDQSLCHTDAVVCG